MKIKFITDWMLFRPGQNADLDTDTARRLIAINVAVLQKHVAEPPKDKMVQAATKAKKVAKKKPKNPRRPGREKK